MEIKKMSIKEFREKGYLQEINRKFLHIHGLALEVRLDEVTGDEELSGIWDYRDDPEGIYYDIKESDDERKNRFKRNKEFIDEDFHNRSINRKNLLGFDIEPIK